MIPERTLSSRWLTALLTLIAAVAVLYFAQDVWIPLALSVLLAFLLNPLVTRVQRFTHNRGVSVGIVTAVAFIILGSLTYFVARQIIGLVEELPVYEQTIVQKIRSLRKQSEGSTLKKIEEASANIASELAASQPATTQEAGAKGPLPEPPPLPPALKPESIETKTSGLWDQAFTYIKSYSPSLLSMAATAGIVVLLVIMMLLAREDIRDRVLRVAGDYNISVTTQAIDEAGTRISRYLLMQLIINVAYGIVIAIGLTIIGLPSPLLWGLLATLLRFIPFLGPWLASIVPLLLAVAAFEDWHHLFYVGGLFACNELFSNMVLEPWLYGSSTGISPIGVVITVVFWTWLWGPIGLLLAVPMTVCLIVMAKYVPGLNFITILLAEKSPLSPESRLYQRLLSGDETEVEELIADASKDTEKDASYATVCDQLVLPALSLAQRDNARQRLSAEQIHDLCELTRGVVMALPTPTCPNEAPSKSVIGIVPAHGEIDEAAAALLSPLVQACGMTTIVPSHKQLAGEMVEKLSKAGASVVCISAVLPTSTARLRRLIAVIRQQLPDVRLVVGMFSESANRVSLADALTKRLPNVRVVPLFETAATTLSEFAQAGTTPPPASSTLVA